MSTPLFESVPGFDQPIAVLKHCHDRIRKQIKTMQNLLKHLPEQGCTPDARQAATAVLQYFEKAAPNHHADEEQDIFPMLQATAKDADAMALNQLIPKILSEHVQMEAAWQTLAPQLKAISTGGATTLAREDVMLFAEIYAAHMEKEESVIAPMAKRLFSDAQMAQLGASMQRRRGITPDPDQTGMATPAPDSPPAESATNATNAAIGKEALAALRIDYAQASLNENDVLSDPIAQFAKWFDQAIAAEVAEANAMSVATVSADGKPSSRVMLIKEFDQRGFTFFTNYSSRKGCDLATNPHAAILFFWRELERQVRIEGRIERISDAENDTYFHSRPLKSRLSANASAQSRPIADRDALETRFAEVEAEFGAHPPRPQHWGGYRVVPERIEFWQGRRSRFHDRIEFIRQADGSWARRRLQP